MRVRPSRRSLLASAATVVIGPSVWRSAAAQPDWPQRPVRLVVGFPAGTSPDLIARALADPLAAALGTGVVVENRAGAAGVLGADVVAKATDAHTFGIIGGGTLTSATLLNPNLPYKPTDFKPITVVGTSPMMLVAGPRVPVGAGEGFAKAARAAGSSWNYGSLGIGSASHLGAELLLAKVGAQAVHVPYNGAPAVISAMVAGDIQLATLPIGNALAQVQAGRIQAVGVTSASRTSLAPQIPSLPEIGIPALNIEIWNAVMAPASTPPAALARFSEAVTSIIRSESMRQKLYQQGWRAEGTAAAALEYRVQQDIAMYRDIIRLRGIKVSA